MTLEEYKESILAAKRENEAARQSLATSAGVLNHSKMLADLTALRRANAALNAELATEKARSRTTICADTLADEIMDRVERQATVAGKALTRSMLIEAAVMLGCERRPEEAEGKCSQ